MLFPNVATSCWLGFYMVPFWISWFNCFKLQEVYAYQKRVLNSLIRLLQIVYKYCIPVAHGMAHGEYKLYCTAYWREGRSYFDWLQLLKNTIDLPGSSSETVTQLFDHVVRHDISIVANGSLLARKLDPSSTAYAPSSTKVYCFIKSNKVHSIFFSLNMDRHMLPIDKDVEDD